jgi:glycine cleavage system transcriptional repressor
MSRQNTNRQVISVVVADRVAILRDITSAVTDLGASIDGISQTVVEGYFTVTLTAAFRQTQPADAIRAAILEKLPGSDTGVVVIPHDARRAARRPVKGDRYVVTITGTHQPGVLKAVTAFFAAKGVNIEDWHMGFDGATVTHIGEITVPALLDIKQFQDEFRQTLSAMGLSCGIQHENIFRATNEVGAIRKLLGGNPDD